MNNPKLSDKYPLAWIVTHCDCEAHGLRWTVPGLACGRRINTRAPGLLATSTDPLLYVLDQPCAFGFLGRFLKNMEGFLTVSPISRVFTLAAVPLNKYHLLSGQKILGPPNTWMSTSANAFRSRKAMICQAHQFLAPWTLLISALQWWLNAGEANF